MYSTSGVYCIHIPAHYCRVFCRHQVQYAGVLLAVSSHIRKPKFQASIKEKINKQHKLMNVKTQCILKMIRCGAVTMAM